MKTVALLISLFLGVAGVAHAQTLPSRIEDLFGRGDSYTVYARNPFNAPVVITDVRIFDCVQVGLGCGFGASGIRLGPGQEASVATVTRAGCTNPVDSNGDVTSDVCSRRARTTFQVSVGYQPLGGAPNTAPTTAPTRPPSGGNSLSPAQRAQQQRLEQQRLAAERQRAEQLERQRAAQQRLKQQQQLAEQQRADRQRELDRQREDAQRQADQRQQQANNQAQQRAEQQRQLDRQRSEAIARQEELRRQQEQQQRAREAQIRQAQDRVNQINANAARAQGEIARAADQARAVLERQRIENQQRAARRDLANLQEEARAEAESARREQAELQEKIRSEQQEQRSAAGAAALEARERTLSARPRSTLASSPGGEAGARPLTSLAAVLRTPPAKAKTKGAPTRRGGPDMLRRKDALELIASDIDQVDADQRRSLLQEFLDRSGPFLDDYPDQTNVWLVRGAAAVELDDAVAAAEAGRALKRLKPNAGADPNTRRFMAYLERKGWLSDAPPLSRQAELEQRRSAAFTGVWKCLERGSFEIIDRNLPHSIDRYARTIFFETAYANQAFSINPVSTEKKSPGILIDGKMRGEEKSNDFGKRFYIQNTNTWQDDNTWSTTAKYDNGSLNVRTYDSTGSNLTFSEDSHGESMQSSMRTSCGRVTLQEAVDTVATQRASVRAALYDVVRFVGTNALRVSNVRAATTETDCDINWTENTTQRNRRFNYIQQYISRIEMENNNIFRIDYDFYFRNYGLASQADELLRRAGELCRNLQ